MVRRVRFGLLLAAALTAPIASAQQPAIVFRPDGSVDRAAEWAQAVLAHAPGERDAAFSAVASWPRVIIEGLLVELDGVRGLMRGSVQEGLRVSD